MSGDLFSTNNLVWWGVVVVVAAYLGYNNGYKQGVNAP
jgi:hypothetical protein